MSVDRDPASTETASPFAFPVFRAVWVASLVSNRGGLIQSVGASWLMISLAASPQLIALVQAAITLSIMLLSLPAGAIADNFDRRRVMILSQTFMLLVSAALAAFTWLGLLTPWRLLAFTFLIGCRTALNGPAWQASIGDLVPRRSSLLRPSSEGRKPIERFAWAGRIHHRCLVNQDFRLGHQQVGPVIGRVADEPAFHDEHERIGKIMFIDRDERRFGRGGPYATG